MSSLRKPDRRESFVQGLKPVESKYFTSELKLRLPKEKLVLAPLGLTVDPGDARRETDLKIGHYTKTRAAMEVAARDCCVWYLVSFDVDFGPEASRTFWQHSSAKRESSKNS